MILNYDETTIFFVLFSFLLEFWEDLGEEKKQKCLHN